MLQYSMDAAKAHEIMARFRPIAPKPAPSADSPPTADNNLRPAALSLRSRARKRGRGAGAAPVLLCKRTRSFFPAAPLLRGFSPLISRPVPVERDFLQKLQDQPRIIVPHPVRPVGSSITVDCITSAVSAAVAPKKAREVEEEVESESLPAVVSDSNNRVRLANSAYKELVGQPECRCLELMVSPGLKRISGEVTLDLTDSSVIPAATDAFSCRVKIRWACNSIDVPCDVIRLCCESNNYLFMWRFKTSTNCKA